MRCSLCSNAAFWQDSSRYCSRRQCLCCKSKNWITCDVLHPASCRFLRMRKACSSLISFTQQPSFSCFYFSPSSEKEQILSFCFMICLQSISCFYIIKAVQFKGKTLVRRKDIELLFENAAEYKKRIPIEKAPITDFYTTAEVKEKYHVNESWIFVIAKKHNIPRTFNRGKTYWSKKHIDAYFTKKAPDPNITEWYSTQEMQEKFSMTLSAIYTFAHKNAIPKKKEGIMVYYSKKHVDIAKGIAKPEETMYYTVAEAMEKFNLTRDQLYHYVKWHHVSKVKKGKYTFISRTELDKLLAPPKIE